MRSNNPVLTAPSPASGQYTSSGYQPGLPGYPGVAGRPVAQQRLTMADVINKTAFMLLLVLAAAGATWQLVPVQLLYPTALISSLVGLVTVLIVMRRHTVPVGGALLYAVVEGVFIGGWSKVLEYSFPGLVIQAVLATLVAAFLTLAAYRFAGVRIRGTAAKLVVLGIAAMAVLMLVNLALIFFGVNLGLATVGPGAGPLAILIALIGVGLAISSLLMDLDLVERSIAAGAPESESWRLALGLTVTLVWLYTQLLRVLSFLRR